MASSAQSISGSCQLLSVSCMTKSLRKASSKKPATAPAIGGALTEKYQQRTAKWNLHFTANTVKVGLGAILKLNKSRSFLLAGSDPVVNGQVICLTWRAVVTGKTVYGFFRQYAKTTLGPNGCAQFMNFTPDNGHSQEDLIDAAGVDSGKINDLTGADAAIAANAAVGAVTGTSYAPLPDSLSNASFGASRAFDVSAMKNALGDHGFLVLRGFIPAHITTMAFDESTAYFLDVLKKFQHGYSIDKGMQGFDELAHLPSCVWEKSPKKDVVLLFKPGRLDMTVDTETMRVKHVQYGGQASKKGVQIGYLVVRITPPSRQPLAAIINNGVLDEAASLTFTPPTHYSPLAVSQKWGVSTTRGWQCKLGLGKCTEPSIFHSCTGVMNAQLWMRNVLACLHDCLPTELCWQPDGVSFKVGHLSSFQNCLPIIFIY